MKTKAKISSRWLRFRALLIDIFLIYVPILYLFYFLLGSKEAFLNNHFITTLCTFLFGLIQAIFLTKKAQSPGLKAYDLYLSIVLAIYGFSNIIGNYIAGKTLVKNANFTLILTPLIMIGFYILLFSFYSEIILIIFAFILGILAGVMNNGTHFMISYPFPKAANFSNGLFISVANIGLSTGTAICGLVISLSDTRYIIVNTIVLLILGIIMIFVRSRIEKMKLRF